MYRNDRQLLCWNQNCDLPIRFGTTNEERRQIAGESWQKLSILTAKTKIVGRKFTKFGYDVAWLLLLRILKADLQSANPLSNAEGKSNVIPRDADCIASYVLNSGVTEPNLTKFLQRVQKWLPITLLKSKLRSSNPLGNANVTNEDRRQIAGESRQKLHVFL